MSSKQLKVSYSKQFARDLADLAKRYPNVLVGTKYITAMHCLLNRLPLPESYQDHTLVGEWKDQRDCHIQGNLVLIYQYVIHDEFDALKFSRLNTYSQTALK
ncbi:YafQ family addiction module toxin [Histophilus somni]|uniref:YafQ family addiction module toxin n=1 Tax=Histophilus somni TaxID=731 RepID=UPI00201E8FA5|nr:type II toxin-antitoxin system YafQ family toxin [Histophilus somni]